ncbi:MAG TPA: hypothetical protein VIN69_09580, partial [Candidatus Limnocylindria bacterium]
MGARRLALAVALACACSSPATASPSPATPPATASAALTPAPTTAPTTAVIPEVRLVRAMSGLAFNSMTGAFQGPDGRWYVLEQPGRILTFREGDASATVFLDIRDHVEFGGEKGLLGFA